MTNKNAWDVRVFNNLYRQDPKEAFIYRKNTLGDEIPEEYRDDEKKDITLSRKEIISLLEKNNIEFTKSEKTENLLKKCVENWLV